MRRFDDRSQVREIEAHGSASPVGFISRKGIVPIGILGPNQSAEADPGSSTRVEKVSGLFGASKHVTRQLVHVDSQASTWLRTAIQYDCPATTAKGGEAGNDAHRRSPHCIIISHSL